VTGSEGVAEDADEHPDGGLQRAAGGVEEAGAPPEHGEGVGRTQQPEKHLGRDGKSGVVGFMKFEALKNMRICCMTTGR